MRPCARAQSCESCEPCEYRLGNGKEFAYGKHGEEEKWSGYFWMLFRKSIRVGKMRCNETSVVIITL